MIRGTVLLLTILLSISLSAQLDNSQGKIFFGGNLAPQLALILNQNNYGYAELNYRAKVGFQVGAKIGYEWRDFNQVEAGLAWTTLGQSYRDNISGIINEKVVALRYIYVPIMYRRMLGNTIQWMDKRGSSNFYVMGGFQFGRLLGADVSWDKGGQPVDMITYLIENGNNKNESQLVAMGPPAEDIDLFEKTDFMGLVGVGFQYWATSFTTVSIEWKNGIGIKDINAAEWRLPNRKGVYEPSRNAFSALNLIIQLYF